ncbi:hypothetical protein PR048_029603 [Dryococelus australis]|uniref:Uncharacterized protein n=1 Tax=Dryococelus australis TaxID=614101 RepID=A0ABQ9GDV1_9NEOP|nr:hypothetical protein PR048_029603 [Dryococelus australis]
MEQRRKARTGETSRIQEGAVVAERLDCSSPNKVNRVQSPAESPDFRKWERCRLSAGFLGDLPAAHISSLTRIQEASGEFSSLTSTRIQMILFLNLRLRGRAGGGGDGILTRLGGALQARTVAFIYTRHAQTPYKAMLPAAVSGPARRRTRPVVCNSPHIPNRLHLRGDASNTLIYDVGQSPGEPQAYARPRPSCWVNTHDGGYATLVQLNDVDWRAATSLGHDLSLIVAHCPPSRLDTCAAGVQQSQDEETPRAQRLLSTKTTFPTRGCVPRLLPALHALQTTCETLRVRLNIQFSHPTSVSLAGLKGFPLKRKKNCKSCSITSATHFTQPGKNFSREKRYFKPCVRKFIDGYGSKLVLTQCCTISAHAAATSSHSGAGRNWMYCGHSRESGEAPLHRCCDVTCTRGQCVNKQTIRYSTQQTTAYLTTVPQSRCQPIGNLKYTGYPRKSVRRTHALRYNKTRFRCTKIGKTELSKSVRRTHALRYNKTRFRCTKIAADKHKTR